MALILAFIFLLNNKSFEKQMIKIEQLYGQKIEILESKVDDYKVSKL